MKKRLFFYTTYIIFLGLLSFFVASVYITYTNNLNIAKNMIMEITQICAEFYNENTDISSFVKVGNDTRITVISSEGTVLADSRPLDINAAENRLDRPEIRAAASGSPETYSRYSETLGVDLLYYALKVNVGDSYVFIRASIPVTKIEIFLNRSLPPFIFLISLFALLCFIFIRATVNRIVEQFGSIERILRSLSGGEYKPEPIPESYEEINKITREIDDISFILQSSFDALRDEKTKLHYILNNISDGLFVVNGDKDIELINTAALGIFNVTPDITEKNLNYLVYDKMLTDAVEECVTLLKSTLFELTLNGRIYLVTVKRLPDTELTMVVLSDVTENRENAKRREEFFANASHELKTPLTAIKGFNELTEINNRDENLGKYIESISRETERMLTLIGDMLKISELENTKDIKPVPVSLSKVANETRDILSTVINEKSIIFEVTGDAVVEAEQHHIYELVKNIAENAVRYNNQGGKVLIAIEENRKAVCLTVSDDGIGISPEEQTRIFERFYRVEKSRSLRNGGTGLGLSIVKHICALYGWKLSLKSKLGLGTEVTVLFSDN